MPLPREVLPGRTYMITRRCTQRQFLLHPDDATNNAYLYCLGVAVQRTGVVLRFTAGESNHHHTGIHDPHGNYPEFIEHFHKLLAKCMNSLRGRWENFWSSEQTSVLRLVDAADVLDKMVYALTNPCKDNLVEKVTDWPGVNSYAATLAGKTLTATRPAHFFREKGNMPATVTLEFQQPNEFKNMSRKEFADMLRTRVKDFEAKAEERRRATGARVLGRKAILKQHWWDSPTTREPRRELNPRVAAKDKWSRIEALQRNKLFVKLYRRAFKAFKDGIKNIVFPVGTYWLRRFAAAVCEPRPDTTAPAPA
jgi:putative transposase